MLSKCIRRAMSYLTYTYVSGLLFLTYMKYEAFMVECTHTYIWYSPLLKRNILDIAGFGGRFDRWMMDAWRLNGKRSKYFFIYYKRIRGTKNLKEISNDYIRIWMFSQNSRIINGQLALLGFLFSFFLWKEMEKNRVLLCTHACKTLLMRGRWKYRKTPHHFLML